MKIVNIKWDIDTEDIEHGVNLPTTVEVPAEIATDPDYLDSEMNDALYDHISDWLSDTYGYCHSGFDIVESKPVLNVKSVVNKILEGADVRKVIDLDSRGVLEGFTPEFKQQIINNPVNKKIKQIASKYGYIAGESFLYWYGGINVRISPKDPNSYYPGIYVDNISDTIEFRIQTTSYGALNLDDFSEFINCCNDAYNMVKELSKLDFSKLTKTSKDFE